MESFADIVANDKMVLIDFFATWCGPCKMMTPILQEVKAKFGERIRILKIDVDKNPKLASAYQVQGVPTLLLFKNGQPVWRRSGVIASQELIKTVTAYQ